MIIGCPSCTARFRIGPQALGPAGRDVRCAKCGHRWHQISPAERMAHVEMPAHATSPTPSPASSSVTASRMIPTAMLLAAGIMFGLTFSLNRIAVIDGIPFIPYVFWQATGTGLLLLVFSFIFRRPPGLSLRHLRGYAILGSVGMALPLLVLNVIAAKLPAGVVALPLTLVPMLTYGFALMLRVDKVNALKLAGLGLGLSAVLVVLVPEASLPSPDMAVWVLVSLLVPLCYGISNVLIPLLRAPQASSLAIGAAMSLTGALCLGVVLLATGEWWWFEGGVGDMGDGDWALIGVVVIYPIFLWLLFETIRLAGPVFFSAQNYVATLSGIGWGMLIHGEAHSLWIWLALVLLFFGLALVILGSLRAEAKP